MTRDSQGALVALNRFGFGARGGAAGDLINAGSDPRGFVRAELNHRNAARLEVPGLQPTPELAHAVFAFQDEQKARREAIAKAAIAPETTKKMAATAMQDGSGANPSMPSQEKLQEAKSPEAMQPNAAKAAEPLNVIQKTYRAEALARLQRVMIADCGFTERLMTF
jgi:uncharacterized protein (DUF1800 family)